MRETVEHAETATEDEAEVRAPEVRTDLRPPALGLTGQGARWRDARADRC